MGVEQLIQSINTEMTSNLNQMATLLAIALIIPIVALGQRVAEYIEGEIRVTRMLGLPRRTLILNLVIITIPTLPLLLLTSLSSSLVFYSTAAWISEYITHTVIPRPTLQQAAQLIPSQLLLQLLLWTSLLIGVHWRSER